MEDIGVLVPNAQTLAQGVWTQGQTIYVVGYIDYRPFGGVQAVMWVKKSPCPADFNGDNKVDDADFGLFAPDYDVLECGAAGMTVNCPADLNGDGAVDDGDFQMFVLAYAMTACGE